MSMATIDGYYTLYEAAERIGVSHSQVSRYVQEKLLEGICLGRQILITERSVDSFKRPPRGNPAFRRKKSGGR
jgi:excisionase family DNA binding protein